MALGLEIAYWLREYINATAFVALHRVAKLTHAFDGPEDDLLALHGPKIEMSHQHQHTDDNDYILEPDIKTGGVRSKSLKPKTPAKTSGKRLDDRYVQTTKGTSDDTLRETETDFHVQTTSGQLGDKLRVIRKEQLKQKDKLALAHIYNGYTETELTALLERAEKRKAKKEREWQQHEEGYHTPEKIEERIALLGKEIEGLSTAFAEAGSTGEDRHEIRKSLIKAQKKQYKEQHALRQARGEIDSEHSDSLQEIATKIDEAKVRIRLATSALEKLRAYKQHMRELGEDLSEIRSEGNIYPSPLPDHIVKLARSATNHVREMLTGQDSNIGNKAAAKRAAKIAEQDVLAQRMTASAGHTLDIRFNGDFKGNFPEESPLTYRIPSSPDFVRIV